ncbi:TonB-dependent receptor [Xanthocytophaga flava]|uniref:TonB-dependent receptor n=1 Tax=Xanthocytophaga flava TaxID=3048013 RepID=UPI0028D0966B|nr:TonB-dependent receptor [Xanthocytophaga flavus]MDJ1472145.1 TonB-dependent receptor [Xanthocytophaga flavus]
MKQLYACLLFLCSVTFSIAQTLTGTITDASTQKPLAGVSVTVKGTTKGVVTNASGEFEITSKADNPVLVISMIGYDKQEITASSGQPIQVSLVVANELLQQVVVSASRVEENILRSPVSIEKMDVRMIQQTPSVSFYDALLNVKSIDMVTSSLTYKQINTRGFNGTGNSRFLQLIDGVDNQTPGLGFAVGNLFGSSDLDVESVELIPGAASALYGPVAFNGLLMTRTKNPFQYTGLSAQTKVGVNHLSDPAGGGAKLFNETALRYAQVINEKLAFKVNASYLTGTDWYGSNYTDIDPNTPVNQRGPSNPGRNALNIYGDEVAQTLQGIGRVSRTGYEEKDLSPYGVYSVKLNGAVHYRFTDKLEAIYQANYSQGTTNYTGSSRFALNDFHLWQHRVELRGTNFFVRAYSTAENSTNSYNSRSLAQQLNRSWVQDLDGNVVTPDKADATWFTRYAAAYNGSVENVTAGNHTAARNFADEGRFLPGTTNFNQQKDRLIHTAGLAGAGVLSKSKLYHIDAQYDLSSLVKVVQLQAGGNFRYYDMFTNGTLFDDKENKVRVKEYGLFVQASKTLFNEKLKLIASGRYDKNENFDGNFTPRASAVFSPTQNHNFRASYQTGFRNPTVPDQFIKLNVGPIIILGGAPANSAGLNAYENSFTAASVGAFASGFQADMQQGVSFSQAVENNKSKLVKSNVPYIRPEQLQSFEIGYKGLLGKNVMIDLNFYQSWYTNFLINQVVIRPDSPVLAGDGSINSAAAQDILNRKTQAFQLYTNAADRVTAQGASLGLTYFLPKGYRVNANSTWSKFNLLDANPNNIPAFNTPEWKTNLTVSNANLFDKVGFSIAWHWQSAFDWYSTFTELAPGRISSYSLLDAQVSYRIPTIRTMLKLGASNLTNQYRMQAYGSPAVGGLYYLSLTFE